jgi:hypothetical protein
MTKHILCSQREDDRKVIDFISNDVELVDAPSKPVCYPGFQQ